MERNMNGDYEVDYFKDNRSSGNLDKKIIFQQQRLWFDPVVQFGKEIAYYANGVKSTAERGKHVELQQDKSGGRRGNFEKEKYFKVTGGQPSYGTGKDREWKVDNKSSLCSWKICQKLYTGRNFGTRLQGMEMSLTCILQEKEVDGKRDSVL
ncbi:hypothetical protein GQ457_08G008670 [Hibiscus cannabinus]